MMKLFLKIKCKIYKLLNPVWGEVLMLHRVVQQQSVLCDNRLMEVSPEYLGETILKYKRKGYKFISLDELYQILDSGKKPKQKFVCFTFDDGYADNYEIAYPIFKKHTCPFAIYISTDFPNHKALLWWYVLETLLLNNESIKFGDGTLYKCESLEQKNQVFREIRERIFSLHNANMKQTLDDLFQNYEYSFDDLVKTHALTWKQIQLLATDPLCTIASHTVSHAALDRIDKNQIQQELEQSKKELEAHTKLAIQHFAYPYGRSGELSVEIAKKVGYQTAVLANGGAVRGNVDILKIKRIGLVEK